MSISESKPRPIKNDRSIPLSRVVAGRASAPRTLTGPAARTRNVRRGSMGDVDSGNVFIASGAVVRAVLHAALRDVVEQHAADLHPRVQQAALGLDDLGARVPSV